MSIPELSIPIRIYWDLTPLPADPPDLDKVAADIIALKILNLDITATGLSIPRACFSALKSCVAARMGVTLTVSPDAFERTEADALALSPPKELLFEIHTLDELKSLCPLPAAITGISLPLGNANWQQIPDIIRFCAEYSINRLVFPMQRLYTGALPFHIPAEGRAAISHSLLSCNPACEIRITAHDPFVWRAIFPNKPFPNGRCQAANTMLSIDPQGFVYPCPAMPILLGDLRSSSLKEIAKCLGKKNLRTLLLNLPQDCINCSEADSCKGGCRGRSERVFSTWEGVDPGCRQH